MRPPVVLPHDELGSGRGVVLLHAGIVDRRMWASHLEPLAGAGCRAIAIDLPGFGEAPVAAERDAPWSDVIETLATLAVPDAVFVGNSFGGAVALRVAAVAPELVEALVLISSPAPGTEPTAELAAAWAAEEEALERGDLEGAVEAVLEAWVQPDAPEQLREHVAVMQRRAFELQARADPGPEAPDPVEDAGALARITAPALVAVGEHDMRDFRVASELLARSLPHARSCTIAGAGHLAPMEQPKACRELILSFLRSL